MDEIFQLKTEATDGNPSLFLVHESSWEALSNDVYSTFIWADVSFIRSAPISTTSEQGQLHTMRQTAVVLLSSNHFPKLFCFASFLDFNERKGCNPCHIAINTLPAMEHQKGVTKKHISSTTQWREKRVSRTRWLLSLHLIGWEGGADSPDQSKSVVV